MKLSKKRWLAGLMAVVMAGCMQITAFAEASEESQPGENEITVCVTMEKLTLGQGYIIEPTLVKVPKGTQASVVITNLLQEKYPEVVPPYQHTGEITSGFYLSQVYDPDHRDMANIPQFLLDKVGADLNYADAEDEWLGEFDFYNMSGWMYTIGTAEETGDATFPPVGAADWHLNDGEVMRWQYTIYGYGSDLNADNSEWGSESLVNVGDKDALIWQVAELNAAMPREELQTIEAYTNAMAVLTDATSEQARIDEALTALQEGISSYEAQKAAKEQKDHNLKVATTVGIPVLIILIIILIVVMMRKKKAAK